MAIQGELQQQLILPACSTRDALTRRGESGWFTPLLKVKPEFEVELVADMGEKMAISSEQLQVGAACSRAGR